jgi:HAD superfamily hydrolase (TIGR01509 family)
LKLKGIIFDMDGLLVDTERYWQCAEISIFSQLGVSLTIKDCEKVMGLRCNEVVEIWKNRFLLTEDTTTLVDRIENEVIKMVMEEPSVLPGVINLLNLCRALHLKVALCSSSSSKVIRGVLTASHLLNQFDLLVSAESEPFGKPHPGAYITTLKEMQTSFLETIVFEDSINGILAAKSAKIPVIAVPNQLPKTDPRFGIADIVIDSLNEVTKEWLTNFLKQLPFPLHL